MMRVDFSSLLSRGGRLAVPFLALLMLAHAAPALAAPGVPDAPTFSAVQQDRMIVTTPALPSATTSLSLQYKVHSNPNFTTLANGLGAHEATSLSIFVSGTVYDFRCVAVGSGSTNGVVASVTTASSAPGSPFILAVDINAVQVQAPFFVPTGATSFILQTKVATDASYADYATGLAANAITDVTGLAASTAYSFRYVADGPDGDTPGPSANRTTRPALPTAPVVDLVATTSVRVTAPAIAEAGATEVLQYKRSADSSYTDVGTGVTAGTQTTLSNLTSATFYDIRYRITGAGGSTDGNVTTVSTLIFAPGQPRNGGAGTSAITVLLPAAPAGATSLDLQQAADTFLNGAAHPPIPGVLLWLRADAITGLANGEPIATWTDKSGSNYHATQTTAAARPTLVLNATASRPAVRFDGNDDFLKLPAGFKDFSAGMTAFVVARPADATHTAARFFELGNLSGGTSGDNIIFARNGTTTELCYQTRDGNAITGNVFGNGLTAGPDAYQLLAVVQQGGAAERNVPVALYRNGVQIANEIAKGLPVAARSSNFLGKSNFAAPDQLFKGDICEVLIYKRALSAGDVTTVQNYLRKKYRIGLSVPAPSGFTTVAAGQAGGAPVNLTGLPGDTYFWYRALANHSAGNVPGPVVGITTSPLSIGEPGVPTFSNIQQTRVRVHAPVFMPRIALAKLEMKWAGIPDFVGVIANIPSGGFADMTGLQPDTDYQFRFVAVGPSGFRAGNAAAVHTAAPAAAGAPAPPTFIDLGVTKVTVVAPGLPAGAGSMKLQRKLGSEPSSAYADIATGLGTNASVPVTGLQPATMYSFRCVAVAGTSLKIGPGANATTLTPDPGAPAEPIFSNATATSADVTAPALPPFALSLRLEKRTSTTAWSLVASGLQAGNTTPLTGLDYNANPNVRFVAVGQFSSTIGPARTVPLLPTIAAPTLNGTAFSTNLHLDDPALAGGGSIFTYYGDFFLEIKLAAQADSAFVQKGHWSTGDFLLSNGVRFIQDLEPGTAYIFRWHAINTNTNEGSYSANSAVITTHVDDPPAAPAAPVLADITDTTLTATAPGDALEAEARLRLERKEAGQTDAEYITVFEDQMPGSTLTVSELTSATEYVFRYVVIAPGGNTAGPTAAATTLSQPPGAPRFSRVQANSVTVTLPVAGKAASLKLQQLVGGGFKDVKVGLGSGDSVEVTGLAPAAEHIFRVVSSCGGATQEGESIGVLTSGE